MTTTIDDHMYQMLSQVQTLDSYISLLTAFCVYKEHPAPYDITDPKQASAFTRAWAIWRNYVITGGKVTAMAGYLPVGQIVSQEFSKTMVAGELHPEFLSALFKAFWFPPNTMAQLDGILSNVFGKLKDLKFSFESNSDTLDHFLTYYYFAIVPGTGGKGQLPAMYVPKVRTFFLHIDQPSWKASLGKSTVDKISFKMNYSDMTTAMNSTLVATDISAIDSAIQKLTGNEKSEINKLMNMQAINTEPQKA